MNYYNLTIHSDAHDCNLLYAAGRASGSGTGEMAVFQLKPTTGTPEKKGGLSTDFALGVHEVKKVKRRQVFPFPALPRGLNYFKLIMLCCN